ncbi:hypothetical protein SAMN02583745_02918 [Thorsellia anophelis DSM 18579]|uniref:ABC transporter substrate-binding protein n=1 Tax=Thorsellia anophelis DSM 18579 TaxID=1123402 RepID=A0A1I0FWX3_9GAMM|nr:hypothetical protein SAMN02583745_02918 [Thorsellia anophelis DSM 18579]
MKAAQMNQNTNALNLPILLSNLSNKFIKIPNSSHRLNKFALLGLTVWMGVVSLPTEALDKIEPTLIENAKKEGQVISVGMPDTWANWQETWEEMNTTY